MWKFEICENYLWKCEIFKGSFLMLAKTASYVQLQHATKTETESIADIFLYIQELLLINS